MQESFEDIVAGRKVIYYYEADGFRVLPCGCMDAETENEIKLSEKDETRLYLKAEQQVIDDMADRGDRLHEESRMQ